MIDRLALSARPIYRTCSLSLLSFGLCIVLTAACAMAQDGASSTPAGKPGTQVDEKITFQIPITMHYLIYLPKDYDGKKPMPLLLFLHGAGERGDDIELVKKHGPPKLIAQGKDFPFIVVSPQCPKGRFWDARSLDTLLDHVEQTYAVDSSRIYVTGLSMGGFGTWALAAYAPERFAAIAPICGGGEKFWVRKLTHLPIWAFHGEKDSVVPPHRTTELVEQLKKLGGNVKLTLYPGAGHDSWTATYDNPELYEWFLKQRNER